MRLADPVNSFATAFALDASAVLSLVTARSWSRPLVPANVCCETLFCEVVFCVLLADAAVTVNDASIISPIDASELYDVDPVLPIDVTMLTSRSRNPVMSELLNSTPPVVSCVPAVCPVLAFVVVPTTGAWVALLISSITALYAATNVLIDDCSLVLSCATEIVTGATTVPSTAC